MNTVNLQISLPSEIYNALVKLSTGIDLNDYIVETIKSNIYNKTDLIRENLIEGYKASNSEDEQISADLAHSDFENWD